MVNPIGSFTPQLGGKTQPKNHPERFTLWRFQNKGEEWVGDFGGWVVRSRAAVRSVLSPASSRATVWKSASQVAVCALRARKNGHNPLDASDALRDDEVTTVGAHFCL